MPVLKNYPKNRKKSVAAELSKLSNTDEHRENVRLIENTFKVFPAPRRPKLRIRVKKRDRD